MNNVVTAPKRKFAIGSVFAFLSALVVLAFWVYGVLKTIVSAVILDASMMETIKNLFSFGSILSFLQSGLTVLSFLVLAVLLLAKVRNLLLLSFPVLQVLALLCGTLTLFWDLAYFNWLSALSMVTTLLANALLFAGNLLFAVVVVANCAKNKKLTALAYICPAAFGVGYGLKTLSGAVGYLRNVLSYFSNFSYFQEQLDTKLNIYLFVQYFFNLNALSYALYLVLFTLTVFFACKWIVDPCKKAKEEAAEEASAEAIEEAPAEPCEEAPAEA